MEIVSTALWPKNSRSMRRISSGPIFFPPFESKAFGSNTHKSRSSVFAALCSLRRSERD